MLYQYQDKDNKYGKSKNYLENHQADYKPSTIVSYRETKDLSSNVANIAEKIFTDRTKSLKSTVKELLAEIETRENLSTNIKTRIDDDRFRCVEYLREAKFWTDNPYNPDNTFLKRKTNLERQMFSFEEQKRNEDSNCWKDLMFLRKYLMSALQDYWKISKCRKALEYGATRKE